MCLAAEAQLGNSARSPGRRPERLVGAVVSGLECPRAAWGNGPLMARRGRLWAQPSAGLLADARSGMMGGIGERGCVMTTSSAEALPQWPGKPKRLSLEEQARRQGVRPILSVDELAEPGMFDSDEELAEFLADLYASRKEGMA